ncbi:hypothetical protein GCM10010912_17190 [Paenibacillus albidus]|uniref:Uncharacterized protein n=1 Tax=Paenibacillus albidus TaxID=2041023 RepID=A0A917C541_9BACL|nr:hypothetical protein [Paenibacillus albidus]GGF72581.1 hypothetical protein GCM10010912_17190 [Paenibacillus albidus]
MEKHTIKIPWDLNIELATMLTEAIRLSEEIKAPMVATIVTPSWTDTVYIKE